MMTTTASNIMKRRTKSSSFPFLQQGKRKISFLLIMTCILISLFSLIHASPATIAKKQNQQSSASESCTATTSSDEEPCIVGEKNGNKMAIDYNTPPFIQPRIFFRGKVHNIDEGVSGGDAAILPPIMKDTAAEVGTTTTVNTKDVDPIWEISKIQLADVQACTAPAPTSSSLSSTSSSSSSLPIIGRIPQMNTEQSLSILNQAYTHGWNHGSNPWTQMSLSQRIEKIEDFLYELSKERNLIVKTLMWEIGKNLVDAEAEFDRTVTFVRKLIEVIKEDEEGFNPRGFRDVGSGTRVFSKRNAIGIVLCLGPCNYPLNETYATILPALLTGNIIILKVPTVGGLSHLLTLEAFSKALPPNTINFISGSGRQTLPPLMESGQIDSLAFIGGKDAADKLIKNHPYPHRLKVFLQLEAKNMALLLKDLFVSKKDDDDKKKKSISKFNLSKALKEVMKGALSYNGQRCTALKIIFAPRGHGKVVAEELSKRVDQMRIGLPWTTTTTTTPKSTELYSEITPLPNQKRLDYMQSLIQDAVSKGASIMNQNGGVVINHNERFDQGSIVCNNSEKKGCQDNDDEDGGSSSNLMVPAVLYPVTPEMRIYHEEQFGPIVPVAEYDDDTLQPILKYGLEGIFGQQVSIFTATGAAGNASTLLDQFSAVYGKININSQCGRSPDIVPFSARRSSGLGVMSVKDALKEFSVPTVVAYKDDGESEGGTADAVEVIQKGSEFMSVVD